MSFGNILGQVLQSGMGGRARTPDRLRTGASSLDAGGGGLNAIFDRLQGSAEGGRGATGGGLAEMARDFLGREQAQGLSGAQIGGIGAAVGALMGGGLGGAARGGALAVLGTLAIGALRGTGTGGDAATRMRGGDAAPEVSDAEVKALTSPETERLLLSTMIGAANADGHIDAAEMRAILDKLDDSDVSEAERGEVMSELRTPLAPEALAAKVQGQAQAAQLYAAAILATGDDSAAERAWLRDFAAALKLDDATVSRLHGMTGAPAA